MSTLDVVVILLGVVALGAAVALTATTMRLRRLADDVEVSRRELDVSLRELAELREDFAEDAEDAMRELHDAVARASRQVDEVEALVDVASAIGGRVDTATEVTYRALTSPVIKTVALASGTRRAARRLRSRHDEP